jgi:hypothetical protein|tara:strand:+ start:770 stop:943 length:174 start_codon:yes stop_codon:yes gene_type:complete
MRAHRENWGVVKAVDRDFHGGGRVVLVRWVEHRASGSRPERWMWASEMQVIEKEPSK